MKKRKNSRKKLQFWGFFHLKIEWALSACDNEYAVRTYAVRLTEGLSSAAS